MPRIIIQAGHENRTSGATGAPGEQTFNKDTSNRVADKLRSKGFEVKRVDADPTSAEIAGDWDLFLAIHYDADVYNADGGFVDFPEPSTDGATAKSQQIAKALADVYFEQTKIRNVPSRSNKNTRYYYMWKSVSSKTPCVIIECGVGNRRDKDYNPLNTDRELVANAISSGILKAFNIEGGSVSDTLVIQKSDFDRLMKASQLGDKLINGLHVTGNIADKTDEQINQIIAERNNDALDTVRKDGYNDGRTHTLATVSERLGLPTVATTEDELITGINGLIEEANSSGGQNGSQNIEPPTIIVLNDGTKWERNGLIFENNKMTGNYKKI